MTKTIDMVVLYQTDYRSIHIVKTLEKYRYLYYKKTTFRQYF